MFAVMRLKQDADSSLQYLGEPGLSQSCLNAVIGLLQGGSVVATARILTAGREHALLLTLESGDRIAVKTGFTSGYLGEGPRTLSYVLQLFREHGVEIDEYLVAPALLERLERSALREADLRGIDDAEPVRPMRWTDYLQDVHRDAGRRGTLWAEFPAVVPYAIIDPRLMDLALGFWEEPDARLNTAYRLLEDTLRERTGSDSYGQDLFKSAFLEKSAKLTWPGLVRSEIAARTELFKSVFGAFRNPRAHRQLSHRADTLLSEFLVVNQLFRLEREAVAVSDPNS